MYIHAHGIDFEWDERKRRSNLAKHGVDFAAAADIFASPVVVAPDERYDYGGNRWIAIGQVRARVIVVAFAETGGVARIRLISARKALKHEQRIYETTLWHSMEGNRPTS